MRLYILMMRQDDPKKCTAAKLIRFGLARNIRAASGSGIILDPFATETLLPSDRQSASSVTAIDCSWNLAESSFTKNFRGTRRRLPPLLAGNPVNYSKIGMLTTAEALSASLFILGCAEQALLLLDKFRWGHTFYELNKNLLEEYSKLTSSGGIQTILRQYGLSF